MKNLEHYLNEQMLNELSLETYQKAIEKSKGRGDKQHKNIEKLALELIKRGETEKVKDKNEEINKIVLPNGTVEYRNNKGELHRIDGPAIEHYKGDKYWYLNGKFHREGGPAIEGSDGNKTWYLNGKLHRLDGPAIEYKDGSKYWILNGKLHREDGPAVERGNGTKEWWLNGKIYSEEDWKMKLGK